MFESCSLIERCTVWRVSEYIHYRFVPFELRLLFVEHIVRLQPTLNLTSTQFTELYSAKNDKSTAICRHLNLVAHLNAIN